MKKLLGFVTACILGLSMPFTVLANGDGMETEEEREKIIYLQKLEELEEKYKQARESREPDAYSLLNDQLSKEDYGGMYEEDGILHIMPINKDNVENTLSSINKMTREANNVVIDDAIAKYSVQELFDASDRIYSEINGLSDIYYGMNVDTDKNSITVYAKSSWTDEMKQNISEVGEIENIEYEIITPAQESNIESDFYEKYPGDPLLQELNQMQPKSIVVARSGSRVFDDDIREGNGGLHPL